ncbi:MAG: dockerin type I repeat-containing protein [Phycisphaerae bacterium]
MAVGVWTAQSASGQCPCEGDVNDDGVVNVIDIIRVFECATGVIPPNDPACALADVNCDGVVDTCDLARVYCFFIGMTNCCETTVCGACCNDGASFQTPCIVVSESMCGSVFFNGTYKGNGSDCAPSPCECITDADCVDEGGCNTGVCGADFVCEYTPFPDGTLCSDGQYCNGVESCQAGECTPGTPTNCDDGVECTMDTCTEPAGECVHTPSECNHDGVCDAPCETLENCPDDCACTATRDLSDPALSYCPSTLKTIHIALHVPPEASAIGVEDMPPDGWTEIDNISDGGAYDADHHKVKWGPLFSPYPAELTYDVVVPAVVEGVQCFVGTVSIDGLIEEPVCGDNCIEELCCAAIPADDEAPVCEGCADCTCAACGDGHVEMCEMIGYACAWKRGCNDDLSGMTRAAYIWVNGECYCWDEAVLNWFPIACESASLCCEGGAAGKAAEATPSRDMAKPGRPVARSAVSASREARGARRSMQIAIDIQAPPGTSAMALEYRIPKGWKVTAISDGGAWDGQTRKVKWGPFLEDLSRTVTFEARGPADVRRAGGLSGTVSFDGVNYPIVGK